jgi:catechol 2,3-dioxygenase-like lactoylglutathione lyase family enzyme
MRMHTNLRVQDLGKSIAFYSALFGAEPSVRKPDYAKWSLSAPSLNFSISEAPDRHGIEHLGIEAETPDELAALRERIGQAGGTVFNEGETTCCYANSDKTWVVDQHGVSWEAFYTHGPSETNHGGEPARSATDVGCCAPECCA